MTPTELYIQERAQVDFPARELWIKDDNQFWAYDYDTDNNTITFTSGEYNNEFIFDSYTIKFYGNFDIYF